MNIRQFECLRAILTTGSMTQAAESLGISQPSASALIANLEHRLGFKLFERVKGRLVATPEAKHFLPDVTRTLDSLELAMQRARQIRDNRHGDLTIAAYPDIAIDFLPEVISELLEDQTSVRVRLLARRSEMMSGLLPTHEYDLAIVTQLSDTRNMDVEEIRLPCAVAFPGGREPKSSAPLTPTYFGDARFVTLMPNHPTVVQLAERFAQEGIPFPGSIVETQTFESAVAFIRRGIGVGLLDPITASRYVGHGIEIRKFQPTVWQSVFLLTPGDRPVSNLLKTFKHLLKQRLVDFSEN